ncbi:MAG: transposase [Burkholderiales bacterium]
MRHSGCVAGTETTAGAPRLECPLRHPNFAFERWRGSLKWERVQPYEDFAEMIYWHGDGIAASWRPENKVSPGFVEGIRNKIRVIRRRGHGLCDEEHVWLKILA